MPHYLNRIRIDTHGIEDADRARIHTTIIDLESGKLLENVHKVEITIQPCEPPIATLTLVDVKRINTGKGLHVYAVEEQAHCPDVDLAPLIAFVEQAECGRYRLDGESWEYRPDGLHVIFKRVGI